jgi:hypothetical protein
VWGGSAKIIEQKVTSTKSPLSGYDNFDLEALTTSIIVGQLQADSCSKLRIKQVNWGQRKAKMASLLVYLNANYCQSFTQYKFRMIFSFL